MSFAPFLAPGRDDGFRMGRPKQGSTSYYVLPGWAGQIPVAAVMTADTDQYAPIWVQTPMVVDQIAGDVTTTEAATNMRFGLYRADADLQPISAPLIDSGDISTATTGTKTYTLSTPLLLRPGRYVQVVNVDGANVAAIRWYRDARAAYDTTISVNNIALLQVARAYAAFPTPGTAWTTPLTANSAGFYHPFLFRISIP